MRRWGSLRAYSDGPQCLFVDGGTAIVGRWVRVHAELRGPGQDTPRVEELVIVGGGCLGE